MEVWEFVKQVKWGQVICENFTTAGRISSYGLLTVRIIGGVQAICWLYDLPLAMQMPQHRNMRQKMADGMADVIHERDALAHLLSWEARNA